VSGGFSWAVRFTGKLIIVVQHWQAALAARENR